MDLESRLAERRDDLVAKWRDLILGTYPEETRKFWRRQKNRFANPVGHSIDKCAAELFDLVLAWEDAEAIAEALNELIKIRAVQDFSPSQAVSVVYLLKKLLREEFMRELGEANRLAELMAFEARVDNLALMAFDLYSRDREAIFNMRVKEVKIAQHNLLRKANMIVEFTAKGAEE